MTAVVRYSMLAESEASSCIVVSFMGPHQLGVASHSTGTGRHADHTMKYSGNRSNVRSRDFRTHLARAL